MGNILLSKINPHIILNLIRKNKDHDYRKRKLKVLKNQMKKLFEKWQRQETLKYPGGYIYH